MARLTDAEKAELRAEQLTMAQTAIEALKDSAAWQGWIKARQSFRTYSFHNQMLLLHQAPDASFVTGARRWNELGYLIRKGERALRVWAPQLASKAEREKAAAAGEDAPVRFRLRPVFSDLQVVPNPDMEQLPLVPPGHDAVLELARTDLYLRLVQICGDRRVPVHLDEDLDRLSGPRGFLRTEGGVPVAIHVAPGPEADKARTLLHESVHMLIRTDAQPGDPELGRAEEEVVVEAVTYCVSQTLGFDTSALSIPYMASWSEADDAGATAFAHGKLIDRLASLLEDDLLPQDPSDSERDALIEEMAA